MFSRFWTSAYFSTEERTDILLALAALLLALLFNGLIIFVCFWSFDPNSVFKTPASGEHIVYAHPIMLSNKPIRLPKTHPVNIPVTTLPPVAVPEPPASAPISHDGHKILRAGTSLNAPDTDHALGLLDQPGFPDGTGPAASQQPPPQEKRSESPVPEPARGKATRPHTKHGHADLTRVHSADDVIDAPVRPRLSTFAPARPESDDDDDDAGMYNPTDSRMNNEPRRNLDFLTPARMREAVREGAVGQRPAGTRQQYGEMKYLHYNRRVYRAMQESMDIALRTMRPFQYRAIMQDVRQPARVHFCLNKQGKLEFVKLVSSSGSPLYDQTTVRIIQEASFPSIPSSFGLDRTYFTYGIIMYEDDSGNYEVGVSPYLEGD